MRRSIMAALLASILTLTLGACGGQNADSPAAPPPDDVSGEAAPETEWEEAEVPPEEEAAPPNQNKTHEMPQDLSNCEIGDSWRIGTYGYVPRVLQRASYGDWAFTISVPDIPEDLKALAQDRGDHYILVYQENAALGYLRAYLYFYYEEDYLLLMMESEHAGVALSPGKTRYYGKDETRFPYFMACLNTNPQGQFTATSSYTHRDETGNVTWDYPTLLVYEQWEFTETTFFPPDEHVKALIDAVSSQ